MRAPDGRNTIAECRLPATFSWPASGCRTPARRLRFFQPLEPLARLAPDVGGRRAAVARAALHRALGRQHRTHILGDARFDGLHGGQWQAAQRHALLLSIAAMTGMVRDMTPDVARMRQAAGAGYSTATDLADWLVRTHDMPFREAHHVTGRIVAKAAAENVSLDRLPLAAMQAIDKRITNDVFTVLGAEDSVNSRASYGGTAPKNVRRQANRWLKALEKER
ncbi:MAG: hypothetical protein JOZ35_00725 [Hyphomicrobiales bacterium]|nr:hypothetical protein [Hyphomicrobiales bacterium]